jgi:2-methylcitrate dehydratase PrpD
MEVAIKPYPCCRYNHAAIGCVIDTQQDRRTP